MVLTFLSDFNKRAADLWKSKKFVFDKTLEVNVDKNNSISWSGKHVLKGSDGPNSKITIKQKETGLGSLEVEWAVPVKNSQPKFTLKTKELGVDEVELCIEGADKGNMSVTYGADQWATCCDVNLIPRNFQLAPPLHFNLKNILSIEWVSFSKGG